MTDGFRPELKGICAQQATSNEMKGALKPMEHKEKKAGAPGTRGSAPPGDSSGNIDLPDVNEYLAPSAGGSEMQMKARARLQAIASRRLFRCVDEGLLKK